MDTPWRTAPKPIVGQFTHRRLLSRAFDGAWVTGASQRQMARRLGFGTSQIVEHLYCCDSHLFTPSLSAKARFDAPFLFVGRLVEVKGLRPLGQAFQLFRQSTGSTRRLQIVGNGEIDVRGEGIDVLPFVEPSEAKMLMDGSFALVHPAFLEHWGVVVHEAASMGLPLILSPSVYSGSRFLFDGINGFYSDPEVMGLARSMTALDKLDFESYERMSKTSEHLGRLLNLESWTENLERGVAQLRGAKGNSRRW
jgi:glycosyltransferase involved in cell wall biosynthesis